MARREKQPVHKVVMMKEKRSIAHQLPEGILLAQGYQTASGQLRGCAGKPDWDDCGKQSDTERFYCRLGAGNGRIL